MIRTEFGIRTDHPKALVGTPISVDGEVLGRVLEAEADPCMPGYARCLAEMEDSERAKEAIRKLNLRFRPRVWR